MSEYKVIFHIDENSKWKLLLNNVGNLLHALGNKEAYIEVLANAEAVKYYDNAQDLDTDIKTLESLHEKGVKFAACNNSLMAYGINKHNLIHFVDIVPSGVLEIVNKQGEGYAYIKP